MKRRFRRFLADIHPELFLGGFLFGIGFFAGADQGDKIGAAAMAAISATCFSAAWYGAVASDDSRRLRP